MITTAITQAGFEVWGEPGRATDPDVLLSGLSALSDNPPYVPEKRSRLESLSLALTDICAQQSSGPIKYVVRVLSGHHGRHVFQENRGPDKNTMISLFTVQTPDDDIIKPGGDYPPSPEATQRIQDAYDEYLKTLSFSAVRTVMAKEAYRLGGTTIDGKPNSFFLPPESISQWRQVADVIRHATVIGSPSLYEQEYKLTGSALEAVKIKVEDEVISSVDKMMEELAAGKMTERVVKNRLATLREMQSKVTKYENLFNEGLNTCQSKMKDIIQALSLDQAAADDDDVFEDVLDDVLP